MLVDPSPLRRYGSAAVQLATTTVARLQQKPAAAQDTLARTSGSRAFEAWSPLKSPAKSGVSTRPTLENRTARNMREHPECFATDRSTGTALAPRSISDSNAADRCSDGPLMEKLWVAGSIGAGAIEGALGLKSRPAPGYEAEFYKARKVASIESVIVGVVSGVGAARSAAIVTSAGPGVLASSISATGVGTAAVSAAIAGHGAAEALANAPMEARAVGDANARPAHEPQKAPQTLKGFPNAIRVRGKTRVQGGGKIRDRWRNPDGTILEWDSRHGTVEKYNRRGRHLGEYNADSGKEISGRDATRTIEP